MGDIVDYGIGLSFQTASISLAGQYENPMPESSLSPQSETKNLTTGSHTFVPGDFVEVIVLMDFSYRDKADTGISEFEKCHF